MGKGSKICPHCQESNGPRSFVCKRCLRGFVVKGVLQPDLTSTFNPGASGASTALAVADTRKQLKTKEVDFRELKKDDLFKVVSGGPVWPRSIENGGNIPIGYYGIFKVDYIDHEGIHAWPVKAKTEGGGKCYIYCATTQKKMESGTLMLPHHIVQVHRRIKVE